MSRLFPLMLVLWLTLPARALEITAAACDELYAALPAEDPWEKTKDASTLAWNESYTLHGLVDMYEATGDEKYLAEVVRRGDRMISHRDDKRNFADWSAKVHKRWSIGTKYTVAEGTLVDEAGKPVIQLRSTLFAFNNFTKVKVTREGEKFTIHLTNSYWRRDETFSDLSMKADDPRYFEKIINDYKPRFRPITQAGTCMEASQLLRAKQSEKGATSPPKSQELTLKPLPHSHVAYIGIIYHPLLRFAKLARNDPKLSPELKAAADRFVAEAQDSYAEVVSHFRDGPGDGEGYYFGCSRGGAAPYDNVGYAFNYLGKLITSELLLFELTGTPIYKEHATKIATLLHRRLERVEGDKYIWQYWYEPITTGWTEEEHRSLNTPSHGAWRNIEDSSHGALEVEMAVNCVAAGVVFDQNDLKRFANTFVGNVVNADRTGFNGRVDGTQPKSEFLDTRVMGWLPLAAADRRVYDAARDIYLNRGKGDFCSAACLLKWERKLNPQTP